MSLRDDFRDTLCSRHVHHVADAYLDRCGQGIKLFVWGGERIRGLSAWVQIRHELLGWRELFL
jgi:hypothetical protein